MEYISQDWSKSLPLQELNQYSQDYVKYWSYRSCGLACGAMAIKALNNGICNNINKLHDEAMAIYAFTIKGIIHEKLSRILNKNNVNAKTIKCNALNVIEMINDNTLFIASVPHLASSNEQKDDHLILIHGSETIQNEIFLKIQDPSPSREKQKLISLSVFEKAYSGNGIMVWK